MKPPLTLADLSPKMRLHLPDHMLDPEDFDRSWYGIVSVRNVRGVVVLKRSADDDDPEYYYLGRVINHYAPVGGHQGYSGYWKLGRWSFSTLAEAKAWVDQRIVSAAGGAP